MNMFLRIANTLLLAAIVWFLYQINDRMPTVRSLSGISGQADNFLSEMDVKVTNYPLEVEIHPR